MPPPHNRQTGTDTPPKSLSAPPLPWPWACLIALALSAQLALIWIHVPWADELQATALARESHALADWYWNFRYEGHAPLWHLLLKIPLACTSDPTALKIVQSVVVLCSAALLHLRAPFSPGVKFLLSLNYFLFFEYGVIARDYSLTVLFFFGAIAFRRHPVAWLFIALLPQGGLQSVMLAGICGIIALREQGWKWWGVALSGIGAAVALVWMWPAEDFAGPASVSGGGSLLEHFVRAIYFIGSSFVPVDQDFLMTGHDYSRSSDIIVGIGVVSPLLVMIQMGQISRLGALLSGFFFIASVTLSITTYGLSGRHFGLWCLLVIGLLWIVRNNEYRPAGFIQIWLIVLGVSGAVMGLKEAFAPFSTASFTASALLEAGADNARIAPASVLLAVEVYGFLRIPTYNKRERCMQTFIRWRRSEAPHAPILKIDQMADARRSLEELKSVAAQSEGRLLLLLDVKTAETLAEIEDPALHFLRFIGKDTTSSHWRYLYRLDVPPDSDPTPIPPCAR